MPRPERPLSFTSRVDTFLRRPELQRVFEEALRLAKDPVSRARIESAHRHLLRRVNR